MNCFLLLGKISTGSQITPSMSFSWCFLLYMLAGVSSETTFLQIGCALQSCVGCAVPYLSSLKLSLRSASNYISSHSSDTPLSLPEDGPVVKENAGFCTLTHSTLSLIFSNRWLRLARNRPRHTHLSRKDLKSSPVLKPFLGIYFCFSGWWSRQGLNYPLHSPSSLFILSSRYKWRKATKLCTNTRTNKHMSHVVFR